MIDDLKIILLPLLIVFSLSLPLSTQQVHAHEPAQMPAEKSSPPELSSVPVYGYRIVATYPHDPGAFTQGLTYENGVFYEGTGLHGRSSLRKVDLETGRVLKVHPLPEKYFGEGVALCRNRLFQLTYRSNTGFIYDRDFRQIGQFSYPTEGWGLTCDGRRLIMSDGTAVLRWLDSKSFKIIKKITVTDQGRPVPHLNELEYVRGEIFANVWETDTIARIAPGSGKVVGWIDLSGLSGQLPAGREPIDVLNGIAYDERGDRIFVTGKFWPKLFEIKLIKK
jgi:glutamine cyclotransferase